MEEVGGLVGDAVMEGSPVLGAEPSAGATESEARSRLLACDRGGPDGGGIEAVLLGASAAAFDSVCGSALTID